MKIVSLNIWGGRKFKNLMKYIKLRKGDTDIFCFQEVYDTSSNRKIVDGKFRLDILKQLKNELKEFSVYYTPNISNFSFIDSINFDLNWGIALFVRKNIQVMENGAEYICGYPNSELKDNLPKPRKVQWIKIKKRNKEYSIIQFHGLWVKGGKMDNKHRLLQSKKVRKIIDKIRSEKILCGDFNLLPNTKSISILEKNFINLIKKFNIPTTRSKFYKKPDKYADYMILSEGVKIKEFNVPRLNISDHLPMELVFD